MRKLLRTASLLTSTILLLLCNDSKSIAQTFTLDSTVLVADTVITGLNIPWEVSWGADDYLWLTEREGKVSRVNPQTGTRDVVLDASQANGGEVYQIGESGMLGFTFHPQFPDSNKIYLAYTYRVGSAVREKMVRYEFDGDSLINPFTLIEDILGASTHNGSRLIIGPDGKLYMTTGDAQVQPNAQDVTNLSGKVLRFNLDGSIPADNPIPGSPVYSWGHRNPQGLAFGPTGILYSSEHGPNNDDEINIIRPARNYGWPTVMGICNANAELTFCADSNVVESIFNWTPTIAPSDLIYYNHPSIPEWQGSLLLSVLKNRQLTRLTLNAAGDSITSETVYFLNQWGRLRDICTAPDGSVYLATNGNSYSNTTPNTHTIIRLKNQGFVPPIMLNAGNDTSICLGASATLNATVSGGIAPLTYSWFPTTGLSCTNCPNPVATPAATTTYVLSVLDINGNMATDTVIVNMVSQPGPITYTVTILDTFSLSPMLEFNINTPAADSVWVIMSYFDTVGVFLNTQNINFTDSTVVVCTIGAGDCSIDYEILVYAYSACGFDTLYDSQRIIVGESTNIQVLKKSFFTIFPNPTTEQIIISGLEAGDDISVSNIAGKQLLQLISNSSSESIINVSVLPAGIYFIGVTRNGISSTQKVIKY